MKKERRRVIAFKGDTAQIVASLNVEVDASGEEWLTPAQTRFLEYLHVWAKHGGHNTLRATRKLVTTWLPPHTVPIEAHDSASVSGSFVLSTPELMGAGV